MIISKSRKAALVLLTLCAFTLMACDFDENITHEELATEVEITKYLSDMSFTDMQNGKEMHFGSDGDVQVFELEKDLPLFIGKWRVITSSGSTSSIEYGAVIIEGTHYWLRDGKVYSGRTSRKNNYDQYYFFRIRPDGVAELRRDIFLSEHARVLGNARIGFPNETKFNLAHKNLIDGGFTDWGDKLTGGKVVGGVAQLLFCLSIVFCL